MIPCVAFDTNGYPINLDKSLVDYIFMSLALLILLNVWW